MTARQRRPDPRPVESRILGALGAGADGGSYAIQREDGSRAELWHLAPGAVTIASSRRLRLLRQLDSPVLLRIHEARLDGDYPYVLAGDGTVEWAAPWPLDPSLARERLRALLSALAEAHRLGVVHGALAADCIGADARGRVCLDLTGLRVRGLATPPVAPELDAGAPSAATDVWSLGTIAVTVLGAAMDGELGALLDEMRVDDPSLRPAVKEAAARLSPGGEAQPAHRTETTAPYLAGVPSRLGAYELVSVIGEGGMGRVYRARDTAGGPDVALKVLLPAWASDADVVRRFWREARVLAQLSSPYVTRFVAANEEAGFHYLVMEHVEAQSAAALLRDRGRLDADLALSIACDAARALAEVHAIGLVHRDVKPGNILVELVEGARPRVKLCDFGIARSTSGDRTDLTNAGTPGTPAYMSPEQIRGEELDARSDVYSLGATLYALLAGRPPFEGGPASMMLAHVTEDAAPPSRCEPTIPKAIDEVVMRCLEKDPNDRHRDAAALADALQTAWRGAAEADTAIPQAIGIQGEPRVYDFRWELAAEPDELWPHVSNTERFNRAAGLDEVEWTHGEGEGYVRTEGQFRAAGMTLRWKENPFEWIAPRRLGVVREYVAGPFAWLRSTVELEPRDGGGTMLRHRVEILPRGLFGRVAAALEIGVRLRRGFERVYQRIDQACLAARGRQGSALPDPFEPAQRAPKELAARAGAALSRAVARGADPLVAEALGELLCTAPAPVVARIRPRVFAAERGFAPQVALEACLLAASEGALELLWDILCPTCRVPSSIEESLRALTTHGRREVCDLDFELDLARSVEMIFRAHPSLRSAEVGHYCIGGPAHFPHVVAQVRLAPRERIVLALELGEGSYRVTGRGVPARWSFSVSARASAAAWELSLREGAPPEVARSLRPGAQRVTLVNDLEHEILVRLERAAERSDAVTAADAASNALFRELFPGEVLAPDQLVAISHVALLFAHVADALARFAEDEARVHAELVELSQLVSEAASAEGGALVRLQGDGVMAVFSDRVAAVRGALRVLGASDRIAAALHAGPARMTTIGGRLDYFGRTLHEGEHMGRLAARGELVASAAIMTDPSITAQLLKVAVPHSFAQLGGLVVTRLSRSSRSAPAPHARGGTDAYDHAE